MNKRALLLGLAAVFLLLALAAVLWLWSASRGAPFWKPAPRLAQDTNPALDVRYRYNQALLTPAKYDQNAEFPLRLDGAGFSFYAKRLRGIGALLQQEPKPMLYDWAASLHAGAFEHWYGLVLQGQPVYEDVTLHGKLGLHQTLVYSLGGQDSKWPLYFPECVTGIAAPQSAAENAAGATGQPAPDGATTAQSAGIPATTAHIEAWVMFTQKDLFFFYAVSAQPLNAQQRAACITLINSLEFDALVGSPAPPASGAVAPTAEPRGIPEGQPEQAPPPAPPASDGTAPPAENQPPAEPEPPSAEPAPEDAAPQTLKLG